MLSSPLAHGSDTFTTATGMLLPAPLELPEPMKNHLGSIIEQLETGCISMIESDDLKNLHQTMHHLMVAAIAQDWQVALIDLANCFNPQLISSIAFDQGMHAQLVLEQIGLARPFQIHQATSIIKNLVGHLRKFDEKHLVIVTDISSLFFDPGIANEDPLFPLPQLEQMRQSVGILQSLSVQGHSILITDALSRVKSVLHSREVPEIKPASLQYSAKLHIIAQKTQGNRKVELISHPYLSQATTFIKQLPKSKHRFQKHQQADLADYF